MCLCTIIKENNYKGLILLKLDLKKLSKYVWPFSGHKALKGLVNPLIANPTKLSNTTQAIRRRKPTNCLSVFDHFVGLAFKTLTSLWMKLMRVILHLKLWSKKYLSFIFWSAWQMKMRRHSIYLKTLSLARTLKTLKFLQQAIFRILPFKISLMWLRCICFARIYFVDIS